VERPARRAGTRGHEKKKLFTVELRGKAGKRIDQIIMQRAQRQKWEKGLKLPLGGVTAQARKFHQGGNFMFQLCALCICAVEFWDRLGSPSMLLGSGFFENYSDGNFPFRSYVCHPFLFISRTLASWHCGHPWYWPSLDCRHMV